MENLGNCQVISLKFKIYVLKALAVFLIENIRICKYNLLNKGEHL